MDFRECAAKYRYRSSIGTFSNTRHPLTSSNVKLLHAILSTKSAWFNQTERELFETHDLPRSFSITLPQTPDWTVVKPAKIDLDGGDVVITTDGRMPKKHIRLKARLLAPSQFQRALTGSLTKDLMSVIRGKL